jgi:TrmH family RNA methyltransferase
MLSSSNISLIRSLQQKKFREKHGLYVIEGEKLVSEYLDAGIKIRLMAGLREWIEINDPGSFENTEQVEETDERGLKKASSLQTPNSVLALVPIPRKEFQPADLKGKLSILVDNISDPGNMGTIIRIAAWFGIQNVICSPHTADVYNPKVVQASMGALLHVNVFSRDTAELLKQAAIMELPVFATTLDGRSVYESDLGKAGIIIISNESRGLSAELEPLVSHRILIPAFGKPGYGLDSLNAGMSAAIICSEFRRRDQGK